MCVEGQDYGGRLVLLELPSTAAGDRDPTYGSARVLQLV